MKKVTFTSIFLLLMSIAIFAQYDDATSHLNPDSTINNKDPQTLFTDDVIMQQSLAVGFDAIVGENFGFNTVILKENNLRLYFWDTSNSASFPDNDWSLTANDVTNGGDNYFGIDDVTAGTSPFKVQSGAGNNAIFVSRSGGNVGLGTDSPVVELQVTDGDTPTLRLEQNTSNGWPAQSWDVAGNETNFFVRDVNSGDLPFKIKPGAPDDALFVAANGNIGLGTANPQHKLEVAGDAQVDSYFYFGDESTDGNWRVSVVAGKLTFEKREAAVWVTKIEME